MVMMGCRFAICNDLYRNLIANNHAKAHQVMNFTRKNYNNVLRQSARFHKSS